VKNISLKILLTLTIFAFSILLLDVNKVKNKSRVKNISLFYSLTRYQLNINGKVRNIDDFMKFLNSKDFDFKNYDQLIIESRRILKKKHVTHQTVVTYDIPIYLFTNYLPLQDKFKVIKKLFKSNFNLTNFIQIKSLVFDKLVSDLILESEMRFNVITTQSQLEKLPSFFYFHKKPNLKKYMVWYSVNSIPILPKPKTKPKYLNKWLVNLGHIDTHFVWVRPDKLDILNITRANYKVVGSMMFYTPVINFRNDNKKTCNILILDVTPLKNLNHNSIYYYQYAIEFLKDIIETSENLLEQGVGTQVYLKPKRLYSQDHEVSYLRYLEVLSSSKKLKILSTKSNIYSTISDCDVAISSPYSSGLVIAQELGKKALYYVPKNVSNKFTIKNNIYGIEIIKNIRQLERKLMC
jgi:polysaccharide biosynthesis PFTS motif protein